MENNNKEQDNKRTTRRIPRTEKLINLVSGLYSSGISYSEITRQVKKDLNLDITPQTVRGIIMKGAILQKQYLRKEKKISEIYKNLLFDLIEESKKNIDILNKSREEIITRLNELKEDMPEQRFLELTREINSKIKIQNDSIRTMAEALKLLESSETEIKFNMIENIQNVVNILKDLESQGYIEIKDRYYKSDLYKTSKELKKKEIEEIENVA
jgi:hypothetical protein